MPPRSMSRHSFTVQFDTATSPRRVILADREKFRFVDWNDNIVHVVTQGDTLHRLAAKYWGALSDPPNFSPANLWWIIADFQPQPIHDPTIVLTPGCQLIIPSLRTVQDRILNPEFRRRVGLRA